MYVDSSALLKTYLDEAESETTAEFLSHFPVVISSLLTYVEVLAVLNRSWREGRLCAFDFKEARLDLESFVAGAMILPMEAARDKYGEVCSRHSLKGADAVHLALALMASQDATVVMVTFDKALAREARAGGLEVWP